MSRIEGGRGGGGVALTIDRCISSTVLLEVLLISLPFRRLLRFNICVVAVAYRGLLLCLVAVEYGGLLLFGIGLVAVAYKTFFSGSAL